VATTADPGARPFWVRASIDASTLGAVNTLVDAVARHWASDDAARRFSRAVGEAAAEAVASAARNMSSNRCRAAMITHWFVWYALCVQSKFPS
jgi:hypothetical protein